jgi:iron complex outermembrane recepter protein
MSRSRLLRGVAAGALTATFLSCSALAQEALPEIDIGVAQPMSGGGSGVEGSGNGGGDAWGARAKMDPTSYVAPDATTGTRTDAPIMETPLNVQVVTQQVLQDQQVTTIQEAIENVSGVTFHSDSSASRHNSGEIIIRGFSTSSVFRNGFRDDNVSFNASEQQFANIERVEVLKGSSAILYGLVEPGGIVNYITKQPQETAAYAVQQQVGSFQNYRTTVDATGPISQDKSVLYRIDASYENSGSFEDLVHTNTVFVAPVLRWNYSQSTQASLEFEYNKTNQGGFFGLAPTYNGQIIKLPRNTNYGEYDPDRSERFLAGFNWSHKFDNDWTVRHRIQYVSQTTSAQNIIPYFIEDTGSSVLVHRLATPAFEQTNTFSTNIDLTGHFHTGELEHTFLAGGEFYRYSVWSETNLLQPDSTVSLFDTVHTGPLVGTSLVPIGAAVLTNYDYGAYLQDQIKLPFGLHLLGGVRYQNIADLARGGQSTTDLIQADPTRQRAQRVTPRVGVLWQPQKWLSLYANYAEGFGPNQAQIYPNTQAPPSDARQWEVGAKAEFFDGKLRATFAYYDISKTNVPTSDLLHPGFYLVTGEVNAKGPELDIQGEILPGWNVILTYANTEARITKSNDTYSNNISTVGSRFPNVPRNTASIWSTYEFKQGDLKGLKFGGGVKYQDAQPMQDYTGQGLQFNLAPYATVNLMTAYSFNLNGAKMTAQLNITNLFDHTYYSGGGIFSYNTPGWDINSRVYGEPRKFMGSLSAAF